MNDFLKNVSDNLYSVFTGKVRRDTDWNTLSNAALYHVDRRTFTSSLKGVPRLSAVQKKKLRRFYGSLGLRVSDRYHRIYTHQSGGRFFPEYLPEDLHFMYVDRHLSDREEARFLDNKCYYYRLMPTVRQPELVCMRIGRSWLDHDCRLISAARARKLVLEEKEAVLKQALNSECGQGVFFLRNGRTAAGEDFDRVMKRIRTDVVIQKKIRQHPDLAALNPSSVNSMRIISLLTGNRVRVLGAIQKIGAGSALMDNSSSGGIICGIGPDGTLSDFGLYHDGRRCRTHPTLHYRFSDRKVPCLKKAFDLVREAHSFLGHFRLVGWDVTIDEEGEAVLIEANLSLGSINAFQVFNGPLFGRDTKKILREVFPGHKKSW